MSYKNGLTRVELLKLTSVCNRSVVVLRFDRRKNRVTAC